MWLGSYMPGQVQLVGECWNVTSGNELPLNLNESFYRLAHFGSGLVG